MKRFSSIKFIRSNQIVWYKKSTYIEYTKVQIVYIHALCLEEKELNKKVHIIESVLMQDHGIKDNKRKTTKWNRQYRYYLK